MAPVHADIGDGTVAAEARGKRQRPAQELRELLLRHLAGGFGELAVMDLPSPETWPSIATL